MLSNPPYGKSWKSDLERMGGKDGIKKDPRYVIEHASDAEYPLVTRHFRSECAIVQLIVGLVAGGIGGASNRQLRFSQRA